MKSCLGVLAFSWSRLSRYLPSPSISQPNRPFLDLLCCCSWLLTAVFLCRPYNLLLSRHFHRWNGRFHQEGWRKTTAYSCGLFLVCNSPLWMAAPCNTFLWICASYWATVLWKEWGERKESMWSCEEEGKMIVEGKRKWEIRGKMQWRTRDKGLIMNRKERGYKGLSRGVFGQCQFIILYDLVKTVPQFL